MFSRLVFVAILLSTALMMSSALSATTLYVDASVSASGDGTSWENAFKTIQEAMEAASDGDTVTVAEGIYVECVRFKGKNIILRSTDPEDPRVVENTIIDGNGSGPVVQFQGTEDETCLLSGFTIRNGYTMWGHGGGILGGKDSEMTRATIR